MLPGVERQTLPALGALQILGQDQGDLTAVGEPPEPAAEGIAILYQALIDERQGPLAGAHRRSGGIGDEDRRHAPAGDPSESPNEPLEPHPQTIK